MITWMENALRNFKPFQRIYYSMPEPLMVLAVNLRAIPLINLRYSRSAYQFLDELMDRDTWSYNQLSDFVKEQLINTLNIAKEIPYYKRVSEKAVTIKEYPILTRDELKTNYLFITNQTKKHRIKLFTSGTSGSGLPVFYDKKTYAYNWAYRMKHFMWAHLNPRDWRITFYGSKVIPLEREKPPFWIKNSLEHQYMVSIFHISETNADHYVNFLAEHQGLILEGFPTVLHLIAQYVKTYKGKLKFRAVFSTGEPLYPFMRHDIEEAFDTKVYDAYGMTECAGLILECDRGGYHVLTDYGYLEILRDNGDSVNYEEDGYLVWTGFANKAMSLIRYKIGDLGLWEGGTCSCGRPYPLVKPTITRDSDYLITSSGRLLSPRAINQVLKNKVSFKTCQFIQEDEKTIIIRVVPDKGNNFKRDLDEVQKELRSIVGTKSHIFEEVVDEPVRRGNQGKIPLIISKLNR